MFVKIVSNISKEVVLVECHSAWYTFVKDGCALSHGEVRSFMYNDETKEALDMCLYDKEVNLERVIVNGCTVYIMNENGKTVDVIQT